MTGVTQLTPTLTEGSRSPVPESWGLLGYKRVLRPARAPEGYDGWEAMGNSGWGFADVLDDFRRLERDTDFNDQWHGSDALIAIRHHPRNELNAVQAVLERAW